MRKKQHFASVDIERDDDHGALYHFAIFGRHGDDEPLPDSNSLRFKIIKDTEQLPPSNVEYKPQPIDVSTVLKAKDTSNGAADVFWSIPLLSFGLISYRIVLEDVEDVYAQMSQTVKKLPYTFPLSAIPVAFRVVTIATIEGEQYESLPSAPIYVGMRIPNSTTQMTPIYATLSCDKLPEYFDANQGTCILSSLLF